MRSASPPSAFANEAAARRVLLLQALESGAPDNPLWTDDDARWATRVARETVPSEAGAMRFLDDRAQHALQRLLPRDAGLRRLLARRGWRWWWLPAALLLGCIIGVSIDIFGGGQHINLLAPTVWAVVGWNLLVYASLLLPRPRSLPAWLARRLSGGGSGVSARVKFQQTWAQHAAPLLLSRAALLLHALAAAVALGLIAGLYLRGLVLDYRAGWQSTFVDADQLHLFLSTALAPAIAATGIGLPDAAGLQALRVGPEGGATASAAPWIHLFAATLALFVVLPRSLLMLWSALRAGWLARRLKLPLQEPYFQRLLFEHRGQAARVQLLTHGAAPSPHAQACVRGLLEQALLGAGLQINSAAPVPYGAEEGAAQMAMEPGTTLRVLLLELSATPEEDSHGALVRALRGPGRPPLLLLIDESTFKQRFAALPARIAERRQSWQQWAAAQGIPLVSADLAQPDLVAARQALQEALRS